MSFLEGGALACQAHAWGYTGTYSAAQSRGAALRLSCGVKEAAAMATRQEAP